MCPAAMPQMSHGSVLQRALWAAPSRQSPAHGPSHTELSLHLHPVVIQLLVSHLVVFICCLNH